MTNNWKESLLKSSLPLEHAVAAIFSTLNFYSWGEYAYERSDEAETIKEFTVDLHCFREFSNKNEWLGNLDILIECKYSSPGVRWVFAPHPDNTQVFTRAIQYHYGLTGKKVEIEHLNKFERTLERCIRGVALHSKGCDPAAVSTAANQVRYALPHLVTDGLSSLLFEGHSEDFAVRFFAGVIVTTAPLYVLNNIDNLSAIENAEKFEDVAEKVGYLTIAREATPLNYVQTKSLIKDNITSNYVYKKRLSAFTELLEGKSVPYDWLPTERSIENLVCASGDSIIVVNIDYLKELIENVLSSVDATLSNIDRIFNISIGPQEFVENYELVHGG